MKSSLTRVVALRPIGIAVVVGCRGFTGGGDGGGGTVLPDSSSSTSDPFGSAGGFFADGSHDVPDGTPVVVGEGSGDGDETASHFRAVQIDPVYESSAGPKFVLPFDIDKDGLVDLLTGWNQSQPVQIHLQRRDAENNVYFVAVNLGGTHPIAVIGDVDMADFNEDGWLDVAILVKETGSVGACPIPEEHTFAALSGAGMGEVQILFSPGNVEDITDGDAWREVRLERSQRPTRRDAGVEQAVTYPELNGYTGLTVGEIDGINGPDVVVAYNPPVCKYYGDDPDPINRIVLYLNPGGENTEDPGSIPLSVTARASGPEQVNTNGAVTLSGGGSFARVSASGLGPIFGNVAYFWTQDAGPDVELSGVTSDEATFRTPLTPTTLTFKLEVSHGGATDFDFVNVIVGPPTNLPPTVVAGPEQTVVPNEDSAGDIDVELFAVASDPDGDNLTYAWTQVAGETVSLNGAGSANANFQAPPNGTELRFRITVSDGTFKVSDLVVVNSGFWAPIRLEEDLPTAGDVWMTDVDLDGDNDVIYTYPDRMTANVAWARNPLIPHSAGSPSGPEAVFEGNSSWEHRPVGHVDTFANVITLGDVDRDGYEDVLVRSNSGMVVQWFRHPGAADLEPIFPPPDVVPDQRPPHFNFPWQVYTIAEYDIGRPAGIAIGDLTGDGFNDIAVAAGGAVCWYDGSLVESVYEPWAENFVLDDTKANGVTDDPTDPDYQDDGTVIYSLTIVDIDGDGAGDIVATFDRRVGSGLVDDTLIWFRNTIGDEADGE